MQKSFIQQKNLTENESIITVYLGIALLSTITNLFALFIQIFLHEMPCPLCLLQRFGLLAVNIGALLSIKHGKAFRYDLMIIISIIITMIISIRQVMLHIIPGDLGYGLVFLGIHLYTWNVVLSFMMIVSVAIAYLFDAIMPTILHNMICMYRIKIWKIFLIIAVILCLTNLISTYLECGFTMCPSDPTSYMKLS